MLDDLTFSSPSLNTVRITGTADADRIEYLLQPAPGSEPSGDAEPTGSVAIPRAQPFIIDIPDVPTGDRRVFARGVDTQAKFYRLATQTGTEPEATHTQLTTRDAIRIWTGETPAAEPYFHLYVRRGGAVTKMRLNRFESRLIRIEPGVSFGFATEDGREVHIAYDIAPETLAPELPVSGTANCDRAGAPIWSPTAPHVVLGNGSTIEIESDGTERFVFVAEFDGQAWGPMRWLRLPAAGGRKYHATFSWVALANYAGDPLTIAAPAGSIIGGESTTMRLQMPERSGTTHNVATVEELKSAIASATAGDEIVLADGTYLLDTNISASSFVANHDVNGRRGMEGITLRSASGNFASCIIGASNADSNTWNITQGDATLPSGIRGITFDFAASSGAFTITRGIWNIEDCRFANTSGGRDLFNFVGSATGAGIYLDCLRVVCDHSTGDCFNGNAGGGGQFRCRFIDCEGFEGGTAQSHQAFTTHTGLTCELWGGAYHDCQTNAIAPDGSTDIFAFFTHVYRGSRSGMAYDISTYGCTIDGGSSALFQPRAGRYVIANKIGYTFRESSDSNADVMGNWFARPIGGGNRGYHVSINSRNRFEFNVISGGTQESIRVADGAAAYASVKHCSIVDGSTGVSVQDTSQGALISHVVTKNMNTSVNVTAASMAKVTSDWNIFDPTVDADYVAGAHDTTGVNADLDDQYIPVAGGNCDGTGNPAATDWVGGTDAWGLPVRLDDTVMDRGARCRQRLIPGGALIPDLW